MAKVYGVLNKAIRKNALECPSDELNRVSSGVTARECVAQGAH